MKNKRHNAIVIIAGIAGFWALAYVNHMVPDFSRTELQWWVPPYLLTMALLLVLNSAFVGCSLKE